MSWRRNRAKLLLVALSCLVSLGLLELGLRLFVPQDRVAVTVNEWDPVLGTRHTPNAHGLLISSEYDVDLFINSKGLRDREFPYEKPPGTKRILCLGDSFTCGYGVSAEQTFPKVLEANLRREGVASTDWEVLNAGAGSTGTAHQYVYFVHDGCRYEPDLVVVCFFPGNDFADNVLCGMFSLEEGKLVQHPAPRTGARRIQSVTRWIPGYRTIFARSRLVNLLKFRVAGWHRRQLVRELQERDDANSRSREERFRYRDELTLHLMRALHEACAERGAKLVVAVIPPPDADELPRRTAALIEALEGAGVPCVPLAPALEELERQGTPTIFPIDRHWNPIGHAAVAAVLQESLRDDWLRR